MQVAKTQFQGDYDNQRNRFRKFHILDQDLSYCGKYLDPKDLKDGSVIFSKRFFRNNNWKKDHVCRSCLKSYINIGFTDLAIKS
jgi:hypothetical protein